MKKDLTKQFYDEMTRRIKSNKEIIISIEGASELEKDQKRLHGIEKEIKKELNKAKKWGQ